MTPVIVTKALAAASANNIAASQSLASAGNVTINGSAATGGVATLDTQRRVLITSAGNDSGLTFTVYGTLGSGQTIQEPLTGGNAAAVATNNDFLTVTRIASTGATASTITVGTNTTGSSQWFMPSFHLTPFSMDFETTVTGTVTYNLEYTLDDYWTPVTPTNTVRARQTTVTAATANASLSVGYPFRGWRVTVTSGVGSVLVEAQQAGFVNY